MLTLRSSRSEDRVQGDTVVGVGVYQSDKAYSRSVVASS